MSRNVLIDLLKNSGSQVSRKWKRTTPADLKVKYLKSSKKNVHQMLMTCTR